MPFVCDVCNKAYTNNQNLKLHKVDHSNERPFACDVCNKTYTNSQNLKLHKMIHNNK